MKLTYKLRKKIILSRPIRNALLGIAVITVIWLLLFVTALFFLLYEIREFNYDDLIFIPITLSFLLFLLYILIASFFDKDKGTPILIEEIEEDPLLEIVGRIIVKYQILSCNYFRNNYFLSYQHYAYLIEHLVMVGVIKCRKDVPPKILVHTEPVLNEMLRRYREKGGRVKLYNWQDGSGIEVGSTDSLK